MREEALKARVVVMVKAWSEQVALKAALCDIVAKTSPDTRLP